MYSSSNCINSVSSVNSVNHVNSVNSVSSLYCGATSFSDGIFKRMVLKYQLISQVVFEGSSSIDIWLSSWNPVQSFLTRIKLIAVQLQGPIIRSSDNLLLDSI